jgi:DNA-binding transcriptional ArsR family regulator
MMGTPNDLGSTLFGKTRRAVLTLTYGHPEESFHLRRIARFVATGQGVLQRELRQLTEAGLLTRRVDGRQTYYHDNHSCPIFEELRSIVTKTAGLVNVRRLDACRKKRNIGGYEAAGQISDQEADEIAALAANLRTRVESWIRQTRPELMA